MEQTGHVKQFNERYETIYPKDPALEGDVRLVIDVKTNTVSSMVIRNWIDKVKLVYYSLTKRYHVYSANNLIAQKFRTDLEIVKGQVILQQMGDKTKIGTWNLRESVEDIKKKASQIRTTLEQYQELALKAETLANDPRFSNQMVAEGETFGAYAKRYLKDSKNLDKVVNVFSEALQRPAQSSFMQAAATEIGQEVARFVITQKTSETSEKVDAAIARLESTLDTAIHAFIQEPSQQSLDEALNAVGDLKELITRLGAARQVLDEDGSNPDHPMILALNRSHQILSRAVTTLNNKANDLVSRADFSVIEAGKLEKIAGLQQDEAVTHREAASGLQKRQEEAEEQIAAQEVALESVTKARAELEIKAKTTLPTLYQQLTGKPLSYQTAEDLKLIVEQVAKIDINKVRGKTAKEVVQLKQQFMFGAHQVLHVYPGEIQALNDKEANIRAALYELRADQRTLAAAYEGEVAEAQTADGEAQQSHNEALRLQKSSISDRAHAEKLKDMVSQITNFSAVKSARRAKGS